MAYLKVQDIDAPYAYEKSFANMGDRTKYWDPFAKIDKSQDILKAINAGAPSGSAGYALTPLAYDPRVVDITRFQTPLLSMIPKVTNMGTTANYYRVTDKGRGKWGSEQGALEEDDSKKELKSEPIKYCRTVGKVTGVADIGSKHFIDSIMQEVLLKTAALNEELEDTLLNGDSSTNPLEHDGLIKQLQYNEVDMSGEAVSLSDVKSLVAECWMQKGRPNLIVTDAHTAQELENQMMDFVRYINPVQMTPFGLDALTLNTQFGRLPVISSQFMPVDSGQRRILAIDTMHVEQRVLQDIIFTPLAKTDDSEKFFLKTYRTMVNKFPEGMGQLYNIGEATA